jgi:ubiquinone/menaquinone biosynthesis C-methylase UbiE
MGHDAIPKAKSRDEIAQAYDSPSWWYDIRGFFILTFAYRSTLGNQVRFFGGNFAGRHLEVAVGSGSLLDIILKWRKWKRLPEVEIAGVDYAEAMLAGARRRFRKRANVKLYLADVASMEFPDGTFDSANVANAVHCFPNVDGSLREIFRVLKPGARLAANVLLFPRGPRPLQWIAGRINDWGMRKGILVTPYRQEDVRRRILAAGFEIIEEQVSGNAYNVLARKPTG